MPEFPENPEVGATVLEEFEHFDLDGDAYMEARNTWISLGQQGAPPSPDDYMVSFGMREKIYFWNGLTWLQWVYDENTQPVNVYIPE